jgi:predicted acyl esterase
MTRLRHVLALLSGAVALAGLAAPGASAAVSVHPFAATAADGAVLRGDVYVPDTAHPVATVLNLSPYWNTAHSPQSYGPSDQQLSMGDGAFAGALTKLLDAGFAVALVNMRGSGKSDGCLQYGGVTDATDGATVVQALAAQPWSNGNVGMYGGSYHGWSQSLTLAARPPALKAVAPFSSIVDLWSLLTRRGALFAGAGESNEPAVAAQVSLGSLDPAVLQRPECAMSTSADAAAFQQLAADGDKTEYWRERDLRAAIRDTPVPAFVASGLGSMEGHITQFDGIWGLFQPSRTRLLLGQWDHDWPSNHRADYLDQLVAFFDEHLRGGSRRLKLGEVEYQDDAQAWHTADSWPPRGRSLVLDLSGDALVPEGVAVQASHRSYRSSPEDTGLRCGGHQVVYASAPVAQDLLIAGNFRLHATLSSDQPGGNLVAVLLHGTGSGDCQSAATGAHASGRLQLDLRHRLGQTSGQDMPVGEPTSVSADSEPLVTRVHRGERLFLAIGGGGVFLVPRALPTVTVHTGEGVTGSIALPVVDEGPPSSAVKGARAPGLDRRGRCRDTAPPRSAFVARSLRVRGGRLRVGGHSSDRVCGVASVRVALGRELAPRRCRFLTARGRFSRIRSCGRPLLLRVAGTRSWTFAPRARLRPGRYRLIAVARDAAGNTGRARQVRFRVPGRHRP